MGSRNPPTHAPAQFDTGQARQHPIEHQEVRHRILEPRRGFLPVRDHLNRIAGFLEVVAQQFEQSFLVFHDQDPWGTSLLVSFQCSARSQRGLVRVVKCQFGYRKVRYRGITKNGAQVFSLLALANIYLARGRLASA